jgi:hypothetical protein
MRLGRVMIGYYKASHRTLQPTTTLRQLVQDEPN